ncbi:hypothetical protein BLA29_014773, partial [Euroglyphus maynei]
MKLDVSPSPLTPTSPVSSLDVVGGGSSSEEPSDVMIDFDQDKKGKKYAPTPSPLVN